jgi:uncharacterized surface protein with fasciclin (FAS1) repeats
MVRRTLVSIAAALLFAASSPAPAKDLMDAALSTGNLNMLIAAIKAAGMEDMLRNEGPFTLFAPDDNHGFMAIEDGGTYEALLVDAPRLRKLLSYHIVPGKIMAADLRYGSMPTELAGAALMATRKEDGSVQVFGPYQGGGNYPGGVGINGATILQADVEASNGVIHIINAIIKPPGVAD